MGHTAEDVPRFVQRSAPRMKTSCYSAILNKALAFSKLPALAVRIAAPRQAASWGAQAGKCPRPARGPLPRPASIAGMVAASCIATDMAGGRILSPSWRAFMRKRTGGPGAGSPPHRRAGIFLFSLSWRHVQPGAPLRDASWLQEKPPCPGKRPFLPAPEGRGAFLSGLRASAQSLLSDGNHRFLGSWRKDDPPFARQGTYFGGGTACPHQVGRAIVSAG